MVTDFVPATDVEQPYLIQDDGVILNNPNYPSKSRKDTSPAQLQEARFSSPEKEELPSNGIFQMLRAAAINSASTPSKTVKKVTRLKDFPDLDGKLYVRVMPFPAKAKVDACLNATKPEAWDFNDPTVSAMLIRQTACTEEGDCIFTDVDLLALETYDGRFVEAVMSEACWLNRYWKQQAENLVGN